MEQARHDVNAFAPIYEQYCDRIYAYCYRRVGNRQDAEDLTSLIFTRAIASLDSYRGGTLAAWLFRIARNAVYNHYRDRKTHISLEAEEILLEAHDPQPLDALIASEEQAALAGLLDQLPEDQRDLLALKLAGGLTSQEIGEVIGKSAGAVRVEIHRIILQLREQYQHEEGRYAAG